MNTDEATLRRKKLLQWVVKNGTPQAEKSLFSQLKGTGSFGEKVARRLEKKYGMGHRYLDTDDSVVGSAEPAPAASNENNLPWPRWMDADAYKLLELFYSLDPDDRIQAMDYIERIAEGVSSRVVSNKG